MSEEVKEEIVETEPVSPAEETDEMTSLWAEIDAEMNQGQQPEAEPEPATQEDEKEKEESQDEAPVAQKVEEVQEFALPDFPFEIEVPGSDEKIVVNSDEEFVTLLSAGKNPAAAIAKANDRNREARQLRLEAEELKTRLAALDAENKALKQFKESTESVLIPPKRPDPTLRDMNPEEWERQQTKYEAAREAYILEKAKREVKKELAPPASESPVQSLMDTEAAWYKDNTDLGDDVLREVNQRSVERFIALMDELKTSGETMRNRDVKILLNQLKEEVIKERGAGKETPTASLAGKRTLLRAMNRANAAPQKSATGVPSTSQFVSQFDDDVDPSHFDAEKAARELSRARK